MNQELVIFKQEIEKTIDNLPVVKIRNLTDLELAKSALSKINETQKKVKAKKESIIKPLLEALKNTRALFAEFELKLSEMELSIKEELKLYREKELALAEKKIEKIEAKATSGEIDFAKAGEKIQKIQDNINSIVKTRKIREVEIVNQSQIPDEYWVIDMVRLRKDVLEGKKVAGTKVIEKEIIIK